MIFAYGLFVKDKDGFLQPYLNNKSQIVVYSEQDAILLLNKTKADLLDDMSAFNISYKPKFLIFTTEIKTPYLTKKQHEEYATILKNINYYKIKIVPIKEEK